MTTTPSPVNPFTQDATDAHSSWEAAQAQLKAARDAFNTGAVVRLKEILSRKNALQSKLSASQLERDQAEADFKIAFESAGFEKTAAVQKILNNKNDAIAICAELQAAIGHMQAEHQPVYLQAESEAQRYDDAYGSAFNAYCRMRALAKLEKHGPSLVEAMALLKLVPSSTPGDESSFGPNFGISPAFDKDILTARMSHILGLLQKHAMAASVDRQDITDAVGVLDIEPIDRRNYTTPAQRHLLRHNSKPNSL